MWWSATATNPVQTMATGDPVMDEDETVIRFTAHAKAKSRDTVAEGAALLNDIHTFLARFVVYPSEATHVAHTLWLVHTHLMDAWDSTPRLAFLSPEPESGKTRAMEVSELLIPNPDHRHQRHPGLPLPQDR